MGYLLVIDDDEKLSALIARCRTPRQRGTADPLPGVFASFSKKIGVW